MDLIRATSANARTHAGFPISAVCNCLNSRLCNFVFMQRVVYNCSFCIARFSLDSMKSSAFVVKLRV
jgi:hypothetical protein